MKNYQNLRKRFKTVKLKDSKTLRKKAWDLMSLYTRKKDSKNEANRCFTCGAWFPIKDLDAGHYIHRDSLDFNFININPQCTKCNRYLHGNSGVYAHQLIKKYGLEEFEKLESLRFREHSYSIKELDNIIEDLKQKLAKLN